MELSDELLEALDGVVETWRTPRTPASPQAAHQAGVRLLDTLDEEYGYADPNEVLPDLVDEMLARSGEGGDLWLGRTAALGCIIEGVIQAQTAEQARNN